MNSLALLFRIAAGAVIVFAGVLGVSYIQKRFDDADGRKALQAVLAKFLDISEPAACRTEVKSRVKGDVRVTCGERSWIVNVLSAKIAEE